MISLRRLGNLVSQRKSSMRLSPASKLPVGLATRTMLKTLTSHSQNRTQLVKPAIAQGVKGKVELFTGNFSYFTKLEMEAIKNSLNRGKTFVIVFDRDTISVPANERAMWIREHFLHNPDLEVRVAYGAPSETSPDKTAFSTYIKKQLPDNISVTKVRCDHFYSEHLAGSLNALSDPSPELHNHVKVVDDIKQDTAASKDLLLPEIAARIIHPFKKMINENDFKRKCEQESIVATQTIQQLNQNHPNTITFFARTRWDIAALNTINLPIIVGKITNKELQASFSNRLNAQLFDMPIYMPGQGWKIPLEVKPYESVIAKIVAAETIANPSISDCNAYLTIDCGVVYPHGFARREGLHVDGFLTKANARPGKNGIVWGDNTYIVSDSKDLQTEIYPGPFDLSRVDIENPQSVLKAFEAQGRNMTYKQFDAYDIVRLTTNNVHAVHPNMTDRYIQRCFLKMTFSERLFNRGGNTINPNFNYRFIYVPRTTGRNTQNYIGLTPIGFDEVDLRDIDFTHSRFPQWVSAGSILAHKKPDLQITAIPAIEGEALETKIDDQVITRNIAKSGDMKVIRSDGDSYFLGENFKSLYRPLGNNQYSPTERTVKAVRVSKNVSFSANWGTRQNIPEGSYIVEDKQDEKWGVHKTSFDATYKKK